MADWQAYKMPIIEDDFLINFFVTLCQEAHTVLDVLGAVPVIGTPIDLAHGVWYIIEGEFGNALLCGISLIPVIGDGYAFTVKSIKKVKLAKGITVKSPDAFKSLNKLYEKFQGNAEIITKNLDNLLSSIQDNTTVNNLLIRLEKLESSDCINFLRDIADAGHTLSKNLDKVNEAFLDAWLMVKAYSSLRKDFEILQQTGNLLKNSNLSSSGLTPEIIQKLITGNRGAGASGLADLLKGYNELVTSGTKLENIGAMIRLLDNGGNFAVGERWVQRYITTHVDEFKGAIVRFEDAVDAGRRVDVKSTVGGKSVFYEFKSVEKVPPADFSKQFLRDLNNQNVNSLDQIRWIFDGDKIKTLPKADFINELERATIPDNVIKKWVKEFDYTQKDLINLINNNFDLIFLIK